MCDLKRFDQISLRFRIAKKRRQKTFIHVLSGTIKRVKHHQTGETLHESEL